MDNEDECLWADDVGLIRPRLSELVRAGNKILVKGVRDQDADAMLDAYHAWIGECLDYLSEALLYPNCTEFFDTYHHYQGDVYWRASTKLQHVAAEVHSKVEFMANLLAGVAEWDEEESEPEGVPSPEPVQLQPAPGRSVFLAHGHDEASREKVARFLERCDLEPVILHEQTNQGRTIIEKFEAHSTVGFAVVLLTPDDMVGDTRRARQNVIFEMGYFAGKLGRRHVAALVADGVDIPSDLHGVVYIRLDADGAWRVKLARELRDAGLSVDAERILS